MTTLSDLYAESSPCNCIAIAHRGASGLYPENTLLAMEKAAALGADMIEFDLRLTKDGIPVLLHDPTIDRTSDGQGKPDDYTLDELRKFNFSFRPDSRGLHSGPPACASMPIPSFEDVLSALHERVCMNIQVYDTAGNALKTICRLFRKYEMFDRAFLALPSFDTLRAVREIDPEIEGAVLGQWDLRASAPELRKCRDAGCRFVQLPVETLTPETLPLCRELGLKANLFYSDSENEIRSLIQDGADGILSNRIDILRKTIDTF